MDFHSLRVTIFSQSGVHLNSASGGIKAVSAQLLIIFTALPELSTIVGELSDPYRADKYFLCRKDIEVYALLFKMTFMFLL